MNNTVISSDKAVYQVVLAGLSIGEKSAAERRAEDIVESCFKKLVKYFSTLGVHNIPLSPINRWNMN